jgi:hypothetical protein
VTAADPVVRVTGAAVPADAWLVDAREAAARAGVAVGTVWSWQTRGKIHAVGYVAGRALYDLAEVMRAERETRQSGRGARRKTDLMDTG